MNPPPDEIYKYRVNRQQTLAQNVMEGMGAMYIPDKEGTYIEGRGTFVNYRGLKDEARGIDMPKPLFPQRNVTPPQAVEAISYLKRDLRSIFKFLSAKAVRRYLALAGISGKKHQAELATLACQLFNETADAYLTYWYMKDGYYCDVVRELRKPIEIILQGLGVPAESTFKTSEAFGNMLEYDWGYRWPVQDAFGELDKGALFEDFPKEAERVISIIEKRWPDAPDMADKFRAPLKIIKLMWLIPRYRKLIRAAVWEMDFEKCKIDEGEEYHTLLYGTYNVKGRSLEERVKIYEGLHGTDLNKQPPRVVVRQRQ
jgi:hypothetical protein